MESKSSLPCSYEPATWPYPQTDHSIPRHSILFKIRFNIIPNSTTSTEKWPVSFSFPHQNSALYLFSTIRATLPTHLILLSFFTHSCQILEVKDFQELKRLSDLKFIQQN